MLVALILLAAYTVAREVLYQVTLHKLINKLMSRNYYEYKQTQEVKKPKTGNSLPKNEEEPFDMGVLTDFGSIG